MFAGFNLKLGMNDFKQMIGNDYATFNMYKELGESHLKDKAIQYQKKIKDYILEGTADGSKLEDDWFPKVEADVFISHSHYDHDLAVALAGWLNSKFRLRCFIDSCVWGYADDLLDIINAEFSDKRKDTDGGVLYNHKKCNTASKHVNIMLCMALQKMIDKVEAVFVINTPNSIDKYKDVYEESTFSPWIYSEIICTQIVRNKDLREYRKTYIEKKSFFESYNQVDNQYKAVYKLTLDHLENIGVDKLELWEENCKKSPKSRYLLDELYKITYPKKMQKLDEFYKENDIIWE